MKLQKRIIAFLMTIALVVGLCPSIPKLKAATDSVQPVAVTQIYSAGYVSGYWDMQIGISPSITVTGWTWGSDAWNVPVTINETQYDAQVNYVNGGTLSFFFGTNFGTPVSGTQFTVKNGSYASVGDEGTLVFEKDYVFEYNGSAWEIVHDVNEQFTVGSIVQESINVVKLHGTSAMPVKDWGTSITSYQDGALTYQTGDAEPVQLNVDIRRPSLDFYYLVLNEKNSGLSIREGDTLRISGKFYMDEYYIEFAPTELKYTGGSWTLVDSGFYDEIELSSLGKCNSYKDSDLWEIYVNPTGTVPGTAWSTQFQNVAVQTGDTPISSVTVWNAGNNQLSVSFTGTNELPTNGNIADWTPLTIKAGKYKASDSSHGIWIKTDFTIYAKDGGFTTEEPVTSTELEVTGIHMQGFQDDSSRVWLETSQTIPSGNYTGLTVEIDGIPFTGILQAMNDSNYLFLILWGYNITTATNGTVITLKAGTGVNENGNITITKDFVMYAEDGNFTTQEPITYTNFNVTGLQSYLGLNADKTAWNGYFTVDADLPGIAWIERFPLTIDVGGVEATVEAMKGNSNELHFTVPVEKLPIDTDLTVTIKADSYACKDSNVRLGYTIASDFTFYASKHGWSTSDKILDANVLKGVKAVVSDSQSWPEGFVIDTNCEDGVAVDAKGWSSRIYPVRKGDSNGQTVYFDKENGVKADATYQDKRVHLIKIGENQYYVGLLDGDITAATGVEYTVGGVFYDTDGKLIEFEPVTAVRNGETESDWMGVIKDKKVEGDINGDTFVDSCDLVRMLRYYRLGGKIAVNQQRLDVNCDDNADVKDIPSLRKVLLGAIYYNRADEEGLANSPYGTPVYKRNQTIERTAYISPKATDENFAKYKAAGFTLLETQKVAIYEDALPNEEKQADVVEYLKKAQQYGLGVLVYSVPIHNMIVEASNDTLYYGEDGNGTMYKTLLREEVTFLKNYPAFKGFFLGDEVSKERVEQYNKVAAYLLELDPDLILFNSQLGLYNTNAGKFSDTIAYKKAAYLDYIDKFSSATNRFVYDTYTLEYVHNGPFSRTYNVSEEWYNNLSYVAEYVKGKLPTRQIKTGVTIQACQPDITKLSHTYRYAPTMQADIGFQVYTALAYGMDEINYYKYEAHDGDKYASNFIGDNEDVYNAVKAVNAELDSFGHVFKAFSWKDTLDIKAGGSNKSTGNARLQSAASNGGRAFVGCMKDADGFDGYMVANAEGPRAGKTATVTLTFKSATKAMIYKGTSYDMVDLTDGVYNVSLDAGEGAFIIPIREKVN